MFYKDRGIFVYIFCRITVWISEEHNIFSLKFERNIPNSFQEIISEKLKTLQRMYRLINVFTTQQFCSFLDGCFISFVIAQAKSWKLHQLLKLTNSSVG